MGNAAASSEEMNLGATDRLIQSVMTDEKRVVRRKALPELAPVDGEHEADHDVQTSHVQPTASYSEEAPEMRRSLMDRVRGYRPTRKHVLLAVLALVVFMRPWLIPGVLFVTFWIGLIAWLTLGPDRIMEWAANAWDRLADRNPDLAETLRQRGDAFALRFDAMLDKLPSKWAEKLALPDMSAPIRPDENLDDQPDPFEKLKLPEVYRG